MTILNRTAELEVKDRGQTVNIKNRLVFDVVKDDYSFANKMNISIYNISNSTNAFIQSETCVYSLWVGYEYSQPLRLLFRGKRHPINGTHTERDGSDIITKLECGDGEQILKTTVLSSFVNRVSTEEILRVYLNIFLANQVFLEYISENIDHKFFNNGFTFQGDLRTAMDGLGAICKIDWSIQDGGLIVLSEKEIYQRPVEITPEQGILGSVVKSRNKIEFTTYVNPELRIGKGVDLQSRTIGDAALKLVRVNHVGDSREGVWESRCEGLLL